METREFQVKKYRNGGAGIGVQIAADVTLPEASEIVFRMTELQHEFGGNDEYCILPM